MPYPVKDIEHGTYEWLVREIAGYLWGKYDEATLDHEKRGKVHSIITSGYQQFQSPPPMPSENEHKPASPPHQWTFMQPLAEIALVQDQKEYDLPDNFSGVVGEFTVRP
jgi:hypothetical protein